MNYCPNRFFLACNFSTVNTVMSCGLGLPSLQVFLVVSIAALVVVCGSQNQCRCQSVGKSGAVGAADVRSDSGGRSRQRRQKVVCWRSPSAQAAGIPPGVGN